MVGGGRLPAIVRPATPEDFERLSELLGEAFRYYGEEPPGFPPEILGALKDHGSGTAPAFEALLVEIGGPAKRRLAEDRHAVGFALFGPVFWTGDLAPALFLKEIFVLPDFRGRGLGRALMASLARVCLQRGWKRIVWTVDRDNPRALAFYGGLPGARALSKTVFSVDGEQLEDVAAEV